MNTSHEQPQHILVAGGAGFLGAHLCRSLLDQGHQVICLDNFQTGREKNIRELLDNPRFFLVRHDVINPIALDEAPTQIYNLACPASPGHYQADPVHTLRTCVDGAFNLLELAHRSGACLLQASTSEVYGDPLQHPQAEAYRGNVNIVGLRSCYDEGKRAAETLVCDYARTRGLDVKIARIFNTYGPLMAADDGRLVSTLIVQALEGRPMTVYGDGSQTRSLCYVADLIDGLQRLMNSNSSFRGPVNLGNPVEYTVLEVARMLQDLMAVKGDIEWCDLPPDDPRQRCPDITLARDHLQWAPQVGLRAGLERTVDWFCREEGCLTSSAQGRSYEIAPGGYTAFSG